MAKIESGKVATYKGRYPLNMAVKNGGFMKKPGEEFTAEEVAAFPENTFASSVKAGDIVVSEKPKASRQSSSTGGNSAGGSKEGDK